ESGDVELHVAIQDLLELAGQNGTALQPLLGGQLLQIQISPRAVKVSCPGRFEERENGALWSFPIQGVLGSRLGRGGLGPGSQHAPECQDHSARNRPHDTQCGTGKVKGAGRDRYRSHWKRRSSRGTPCNPSWSGVFPSPAHRAKPPAREARRATTEFPKRF